MAGEQVLGIDVGGTGIKVAVVDLDSGELVTERKRIATPHPAKPHAVGHAISELLSDEAFEKVEMAGVGFPAVIKDGHAETASNIDEDWVGADVERLMTHVTGKRTFVGNDADVAGLAEVRWGAGKGVEGVVLMLTLGTGIGSGLFLDGVLVPNTELGHIEIRGKDAERRAAASVRERKELSWGKYAKRLERYLEKIDSVLWPDLVIIGGGISAEPEKFLPRIHTRAPVVPAKLGNDAGIIGAALYAAERAKKARISAVGDEGEEAASSS